MITAPLSSELMAPQSASSSAPPTAASPDSDTTWQYDHAWRILNLNQELIRSTDQKTYMLLVMSTLLINFSSNNLDRFIPPGRIHDLALAAMICVALVFFAFALATMLARHNRTSPPGPLSKVFFGHVVGHGAGIAYREAFRHAARADALNDLLEQVVIVSDILVTKLRNYRRAWISLAVEIAIFLTVMVLGQLL